jgi:hypothetical protein
MMKHLSSLLTFVFCCAVIGLIIWFFTPEQEIWSADGSFKVNRTENSVRINPEEFYIKGDSK